MDETESKTTETTTEKVGGSAEVTTKVLQSALIVDGILLALMKLNDLINDPQEQLKLGKDIAGMLNIPVMGEEEEVELFRGLALITHRSLVQPLIQDIRSHNYQLGDIPFGTHLANFARALLPFIATTGLQTVVSMVDTDEERKNIVNALREKFGIDIPFVSDANENALGAILLKIAHDTFLSRALDYMKAEYGA